MTVILKWALSMAMFGKNCWKFCFIPQKTKPIKQLHHLHAYQNIFSTVMLCCSDSLQFSSVAQSCPTLCDPMNRNTPALSITNSQSPPKPMSIELMMPSNYLILCCLLLMLPSISASIRVFSNESILCIRWPKSWSFGFSISPSNKYSELISFGIDCFDLLAV